MINKQNILVKKRSGEVEYFDKDKLVRSLRKIDSPDDIADDVVAYCHEKKIKEITSERLYRLVRRFLMKRGRNRDFMRYNLPAAISRLGPEGFAFEKYIGEVFKVYGYKNVYVGKKIRGRCVTHEMDIVTSNDTEMVTAELKFHNSRAKKTDLKVTLYMKARFNDILDTGFYEDKIPRQLIITNTKFTKNAKKYAKCAGIEVLSWNYPESNNLHDFLLKSGINPVTAISKIPKKAQEDFVKRKIVTCKQIMSNTDRHLVKNRLVPNDRVEDIIQEIKDVCFVLSEQGEFVFSSKK